jgi:hypothetical protein
VAEPFNLPSGNAVPSNSTYEAITNALFPGLDCDQAELTQEVSNSTGPLDILADVTFRSNSCKGQVALSLADPTQTSVRYNNWASENYVGDVQIIDCSGRKEFLVTVTQTDKNLRITNHR